MVIMKHELFSLAYKIPEILFLIRIQFPIDKQNKFYAVICYCHDITDSLKEYYFKMGTEQEYNVPRIIQITDSFGNTIHLHKIENLFFAWHLNRDSKYFLRPGETLGVENEIDPSFEPSSYTIE